MSKNQVYFDVDMESPETIELEQWNAVCFSRRSDLSKNNEDSLGVVAVNENTTIIALADGAGGHKGGGKASQLTIENLVKNISGKKSLSDLKISIIDSFEIANNDIFSSCPGAATTLVVASVSENEARFYFAGDSIALVVGGRGKLKYRTWGHNPVDLGIQAGILDAGTYDEDGIRHMVTNIIGSKDLHIESSIGIPLDPRDTILICSDGLYDNVKVEEICEIVGDRDIKEAAVELSSVATARMKKELKEFSKYDDLSFILLQKK